MSRPLVISALAIIAVIFVLLFASAVQSHHHVRLLQRELDQAKQQIAHSKQANANLATKVSNLETEVDEAHDARTDMQGDLSEANSIIEQLRKELDASQSQMKENQTHAQELTNELEKTKKEAYAQLTTEREASQRRFETITDETTKKLSESEKRVADLTDQLKSVSAQMEQLKTEKDNAEFQERKGFRIRECREPNQSR